MNYALFVPVIISFFLLLLVSIAPLLVLVVVIIVIISLLVQRLSQLRLGARKGVSWVVGTLRGLHLVLEDLEQSLNL